MNRTAVLNVVGLTECLLGERTPGITAFRKRGAVVNLDATDALHGDDFIRAILREYLRDLNLAGALEHDGKALGVAGLQAVIELARPLAAQEGFYLGATV